MSSLHVTKTELAAAVTRGVRQCVVIGWPTRLHETLADAADESLQVFAVDERERPVSPATFVPTEFASESLAEALEKSDFDKLKASLFVWLGDAGYRTLDGALDSLAFIGSLPKGSGVVFDYAVERTSHGSMTHTALDALASRVCEAGGTVRYLIQPQALTVLLSSLGFEKIVDLTPEGVALSGGRLVSAVV